jgi:hypothetical protein
MYGSARVELGQLLFGNGIELEKAAEQFNAAVQFDRIWAIILCSIFIFEINWQETSPPPRPESPGL